MAAPIRRRIEPGIFERIGAEGERLGLELQYKDADGRPRRRSVKGGINEARDALAQARTRRTHLEPEPADIRMTLCAVIEQYEAAHAGDRANTRAVYRAAFASLRPVEAKPVEAKPGERRRTNPRTGTYAWLGAKRISAITRADLRTFVSGEIGEGLKANTIRSHYSAIRAAFSFAREDLELPVTFPGLKSSDLPDPADDQREHRVLADDELARVLEACDERSRLYFRTVAETGARASEALGLTGRRIGGGEIVFAEQLARSGKLAPLKTKQSRRTIEVTGSHAAALSLAAVPGARVFEHLTHRGIERSWSAALEGAELADPQPVIHDLRHTHASRLIAAGWDPVEIAKRLGDRVETVRVYVHEFDARRRSAERRAALESLYGEDGYQMATEPSSRAVADGAKVQRLRTSR